MRTAVCVVAGLLAVAALWLMLLGVVGAAVSAAVWAVLLGIGLFIERWRYKALRPSRPGPGWIETEERFIDPETGKLVTVYFHPATGERRYTAH